MRAISLFILLFFVLFLGYFSFYLYKNYLPIEEKSFFIISEKKEIEVNASSYLKQFVQNMRFSKNNLSYYFYEDCLEDNMNRMKNSFDIIQNETEIISFYEIKDNSADILVFCSDKLIEKESEENKRTFIAGEGGPSKFLNLTPYPLILQGEIKLYSKEKIEDCNYPIVELHELLHVFGYEHFKEEKSVLYPYLKCNQRLDKEIISDLKNIYSVSPKAELFFVNSSAIKKGAYLDFSVEVKNTGIIEAKNVSLFINDEKDEIKVYSLGDISSGYTKSLEVQNLFLKNPKTKSISFRIFSFTKEYSYENNIVKMSIEQQT
ncbi:MAG: matrixin family metalloprotease [Candidatus Pacearchaeota archaeon]